MYMPSVIFCINAISVIETVAVAYVVRRLVADTVYV